MKNRDEYIGVEMEHVARNLLSLDRADDVVISLDTVAGEMAALGEMTENEFAALKQVKTIDAILPRVVVLEQTFNHICLSCNTGIRARAWSGSHRGKRYSTRIEG